MGEFKGTKGKWISLENEGIEIENSNEWVFETGCGCCTSGELNKYDGELMADAGNVRQQINIDLPELLKQRNEMLSMLEKVNATILGDTGGSLELIKLRREIESLIKKATEV